MIHYLDQNPSVLNNYLAELRDVDIQTDPMKFRYNLNKVGEIFAYEISKGLNYEEVKVQTPLGVATCNTIKDKLVLGAILRAGLPLHQGLLNVFNNVENAFISAYRKHNNDGSFDIHMEYITCPNVEGKVLILADPMLATGASIDASLKSIEEYGKPSKIHVVVAVASADGINYIQRNYPDVELWVGSRDEELTAKSYIVPGLGDAGDLAFGSKLQD